MRGPANVRQGLLPAQKAARRVHEVRRHYSGQAPEPEQPRDLHVGEEHPGAREDGAQRDPGPTGERRADGVPGEGHQTREVPAARGKAVRVRDRVLRTGGREKVQGGPPILQGQAAAEAAADVGRQEEPEAARNLQDRVRGVQGQPGALQGRLRGRHLHQDPVRAHRPQNRQQRHNEGAAQDEEREHGRGPVRDHARRQGRNVPIREAQGRGCAAQSRAAPRISSDRIQEDNH